MVVAEDGVRGAAGTLDPERKAPEDDGVAVVHLALGDLLAVHERPVPAAEVGQDAVIPMDPETHVAP
jgi:hypothetical protein